MLAADPMKTVSAASPRFVDPKFSGLEIHLDHPVIPGGPGWDNGFVQPASALFHHGEYYLFYNGMRDAHQASAIGYATSADGIQWTKRTAQRPVFQRSDVRRDPPPSTVSAGAVLVERDTWVMYFVASPLVHDTFRGVILRATAPSPDGPWTPGDTPMLEPGPAGAWDSYSVGLADVIRVGSEYRMYYVSGGGLGMAVSPNGMEWTKYDDPRTTDARRAQSDPVLPGFMEYPTVQKIPGGWALVFRTAFGAHYYVSADGIVWAPGSENPFLILSRNYFYGSQLFVHDGVVDLFFEEGADGAWSTLRRARWTLRDE